MLTLRTVSLCPGAQTRAQEKEVADGEVDFLTFGRIPTAGLTNQIPNFLVSPRGPESITDSNCLGILRTAPLVLTQRLRSNPRAQQTLGHRCFLSSTGGLLRAHGEWGERNVFALTSTLAMWG